MFGSGLPDLSDIVPECLIVRKKWKKEEENFNAVKHYNFSGKTSTINEAIAAL